MATYTSQTIGLGTVANDGLGDSLRAAMDKVNDNFGPIFVAMTLDDADPIVTFKGYIRGVADTLPTLTVNGQWSINGDAAGGLNFNSFSTSNAYEFRSNGTVIASIDTSGVVNAPAAVVTNGVYFGTETAANLQDDYEEGTWTPTAVFSAGSGTITYLNQLGTYTKVGNLVTIRLYLATSSIASRTGTMTIGGLPFTSGATHYGSVAVGWAFGISITSSESLAGRISPSTAVIDLRQWDSSSGTSVVTNAEWLDASQVMLTAQYTV